MAGSYNHAVTASGNLRSNEAFANMIENIGDAYEMAEEMWGMIWFLAQGDPQRVELARTHYREGRRLKRAAQFGGLPPQTTHNPSK